MFLKVWSNKVLGGFFTWRAEEGVSGSAGAEAALRIILLVLFYGILEYYLNPWLF